jgi:hypothetical protein
MPIDIFQAEMSHFPGTQAQASQEQEDGVIPAAKTSTTVAAFQDFLDLSRF